MGRPRGTKQQIAVRLERSLIEWLRTYGDGNVTEGVRRAAREMRLLEVLERDNPGVPLRGALDHVARALVAQKHLTDPT